MFWNNAQGNLQFTLALVTGATSGIGLCLCRLLASKGINLIVHGRDAGKLAALAEELSGQVKVQTVVADLKYPDQQKLVADLISKQAPDLLINNAGFGYYGEILSHPTDDQLTILHVDGEAVIRLSIEAARALIANTRTGVIMNISSAAAFTIFPNFTTYSATKAMINQFSESFDAEISSQGVRVLAACPGVVATNFRSSAGGKTSKHRDAIEAMTPEFAANEVWKQIQNGQPIRIFNWKYRLAIFLVRYLLPKKLVASRMKQSINQIQDAPTT